MSSPFSGWVVVRVVYFAQLLQVWFHQFKLLLGVKQLINQLEVVALILKHLIVEFEEPVLTSAMTSFLALKHPWRTLEAS